MSTTLNLFHCKIVYALIDIDMAPKYDKNNIDRDISWRMRHSWH